ARLRQLSARAWPRAWRRLRHPARSQSPRNRTAAYPPIHLLGLYKRPTLLPPDAAFSRIRDVIPLGCLPPRKTTSPELILRLGCRGSHPNKPADPPRARRTTHAKGSAPPRQGSATAARA